MATTTIVNSSRCRHRAMTLIHGTEKLPLMFRRFCRFCLVGATGVIVDMLLFYSLMHRDILHGNLGIPKVCSAEVAVLNNFIWNELWTFRGTAEDALLTVRDSRLYRSEFDTFEEYCRVKCSYGKSHSYRLMAAAEVVKHLSPCGDVLPATEAQVRPLLGLQPEEQKSAWKSVLAKVGNNQVTTKVIKEAVAQFRKTKEKIKRIPLNLTLLDLISKLRATLKNESKETMTIIGKLEGGVRKLRTSKQSQLSKPNGGKRI